MKPQLAGTKRGHMGNILKKTEIPGPKSKALMAEREKYITRGVTKIHPIFTAKAKGACLEDVDGNIFLDFGCGIGVTNLGHSFIHFYTKF